MAGAEESIPETIRTAEDFGARLRELRGRITQETLARRSVIDHAALSRQRVSNIENGLLPSAEQLRCYLRGCGREDLFEGLETTRQRLAAAPPPRQSWPRRLALAGGVVAAIVAILLAVATLTGPDAGRPGGAVATPECAQGFICFWAEQDFAGRKLQQSPDWASDSHCIRLPFVVRSVMNNSRERQRGYANSDCSDLGTVLQHLGGTERAVDINAYKHT